MIRKTLPLAHLVLGALLLVHTHGALANSASQVTNALECKQALIDTNEARNANPELGPKSAKIFEEVIGQAEAKCAANDFAAAAELINIARGMVASE